MRPAQAYRFTLPILTQKKGASAAYISCFNLDGVPISRCSHLGARIDPIRTARHSTYYSRPTLVERSDLVQVLHAAWLIWVLSRKASVARPALMPSRNI